jgi:hypothetical protein
VLQEPLPVLAVSTPEVPPVPVPDASDMVNKKRCSPLPVTRRVVVKLPWVPLNALLGMVMFCGVL